MPTTWIVIPAYNPSEKLPQLIDSLFQKDLIHIIVVNDGSDAFYNPIFDILKNKNIVLLTHEKNKGKGAALKTAFNYLLNHDKNCLGVVTADSDLQHLDSDIAMMADALKKEPRHFHLGVRTFHHDIPLRSRFGNQLTQRVFRFIFKQEMTDTQTGLRAIPETFLSDVCAIQSNGYAFELEMLIVAVKKNMMVDQHAITTVYIEGNKSSHFNPIIDSIKIYWVFLRHLMTK